MLSQRVRRVVRMHGPFVTASDARAYSIRLPPGVLAELRNFVMELIMNGELLRMRVYVRDTPADLSFVRPARAIYSVGSVVRELAFAGVAGFGLGAPFPWDGIPDGDWADPANMSAVELTCRAWLHMLQQPSAGDRNGYIQTRLCADLLELRDTNFGTSIDAASCSPRAGFVARSPSSFWDLVSERASLLRAARGLSSGSGTRLVRGDENRSATVTGLFAGALYTPWRFGDDVLDMPTLCRAACSATDWPTRRDATILLCNTEACDDLEASELIRRLLACIGAASDDVIARAIWSRSLLLTKSCMPALLSRLPTQEWEAYQESGVLVRRDAALLEEWIVDGMAR